MKCLLCKFDISGSLTTKNIFDHYVNNHNFSIDNDILMNYLASLIRKDAKYIKTCRYCHRSCLTRRDFCKHMLCYHYQMGGGGKSSAINEKLEMSPITYDAGKGGISFRTLSYKASDLAEHDTETLSKSAVNPYDLSSFDVLFTDLEQKLRVLHDELHTGQSILLGGSFGVIYSRPKDDDETNTELGHPQTYSLPSYDLSDKTAFGIRGALIPMKRLALSMIGTTAQAGSRWSFHRLVYMSFNVISVDDGVVINDWVVGGKKRVTDNTSKPYINTKKAKLEYYKSSEFLQMEARESAEDSSGAELTFDEDTYDPEMTAEDIAMIDDRSVDEEYTPINYIDMFEHDKTVQDDIDTDEIIEEGDISKEIREKLDKTEIRYNELCARENEGCLNLESGLNLTDYIVDKKLIYKLKKRQFEALDHNEKPPGECVFYYSLVMGLLHQQDGKPTTGQWRRPWDTCEDEIRPVEVMDVLKRYKSQLKNCLLTTLLYVLEELNDALASFDISFSLFKVKDKVNFVRVFANTRSKYIKK